MKNKINDGGPAFPVPALTVGVSVRDYFAAAALQGFCANQRWNPIESIHFANLAEDAFIAADAMLKAREVKP